MVSYSARVSRTPFIRTNVTMVFVAFTVQMHSSDLYDGAAFAYGRSYHEVLLNLVNLSPLVNSVLDDECDLHFDDIPADVTIRVDEVLRLSVYDMYQAMLRYCGRIPYEDQLAQTKARLQAYFAGRNHSYAQTLQVSLICPLTYRKIEVPCRGIRCSHVQCFDAYAYLNFNEATPQPPWRCPICYEQVLEPDMQVDLLMLRVLETVDDLCEAVVFRPDASWASVIPQHRRLSVADIGSPP
ncbi:hypothetical protein V5799_019743 [Amblyomma americanum]|uniref:SP-RING-type domain-containing protein n=1 Tax=Amblyomma americanum TaxID=6943 RepID=A0AAQ4EVR3_AMBAM